MVPEGWFSAKIGEIANIQVGRDLKEEAYSEVATNQHTIPVFSNTVENRGLYGYYNFEEYPGNSVTIVGRGIGLGTAFSRKSGFGAIGRLLIVSPRNGSFDVEYLENYINFRLRIFNESGGIPQLPGASLAKYSVTLPPLSEQKKIARILSTWDKAIETVKKLIENSKAQKKALMQQLLTGKRRLPGFDGKWKTVRLGDIGDISSAGVDKKINKGEEPVRLLNYLDVLNRDFISDEQLSHWVTAPDRKIHNCNILKGDVFFTPSSETRDDIAHSAVATETIPKAAYSYHIIRFRLHENWDLIFRTYAFKTPYFYKQAYSLCEGSGQRYVISQRYFRNMTVHIPLDIEEQYKIASILSTNDKEIETLQQKLDCLKQEKKALMQQLLTGKRRVQIN